MVFNNLSYDFLGFNWDSDVKPVDAKVGAYIDEIGPDFRAFQELGADPRWELSSRLSAIRNPNSRRKY